MHRALVVIPLVLSVVACGDGLGVAGSSGFVEDDAAVTPLVTVDASLVVPAGDDDDSDAGPSEVDTDAEVDVDGATVFGDDDASSALPVASDGAASASTTDDPLRDCGDVIIKVPSDVAPVQSCRSAARVEISFGPFDADEDAGSAPALGAIDLPHLKSAGSVFVSHANLTSLSLGELTTVSGHFYIDDTIGLQAVDASQLAQLGEYLYIDDNPSLVTLDLAHLRTVGQYIYVTNNAQLAALSFADVMQVGPSPNADVLYFANNPAWCPPTTATMAILASGGGYVAQGDGCGR